jgi:ribulose 1,5-bisphosphate carboxylase large subunit-like protein
MNKLSLVRMQLAEKYKENFDVSSEGPSSGVNSTRRAFAGNAEIPLIFFR